MSPSRFGQTLKTITSLLFHFHTFPNNKWEFHSSNKNTPLNYSINFFLDKIKELWGSIRIINCTSQYMRILIVMFIAHQNVVETKLKSFFMYSWEITHKMRTGMHTHAYMHINSYLEAINQPVINGTRKKWEKVFISSCCVIIILFLYRFQHCYCCIYNHIFLIHQKSWCRMVMWEKQGNFRRS